MKPRYIKRIQAQSRDLRVMPINRHTLVVESRSDPLHNHVVHVTFRPDGEVLAVCTCDWAKHHGVACAHVMAALEHLAEQKGRRLSFWLTEGDARRQKQRIFYLCHGNDRSERVYITSRNDPDKHDDAA